MARRNYSTGAHDYGARRHFRHDYLLEICHPSLHPGAHIYSEPWQAATADVWKSFLKISIWCFTL
jgi:hypothetical protein